MAWLQIAVHTRKEYSEQSEQTLFELGAVSVTLSDAADDPILEPAPGETPIWQHIIVTALFDDSRPPQALIEHLQTVLPDAQHRITFEVLEEQDWSRAWMEHYQPMQFGKRLWVCPWHIEPPEPQAINLRLDPGLAFGTGTHPTTSLCLHWLEQHCRQQNSLLDFGCGSGILAIAALLLGVKQADGVDIDPQALEASQQNAIANNVDQRLRLYSAEQRPEAQYDIVVANILSGPLVELAHCLAKHTLAGGDIVLSGILREQADDILDAYERDFEMQPPVFDQDWALLHGCRKNQSTA